MAKKKNNLNKELENIYRQKDAFIRQSLKQYDKDIVGLQEMLFNFILSEYVSNFDYIDGKLTTSAKNYRLLSGLDSVYAKFQKTFQEDVLLTLGNNMLATNQFSEAYYNKASFSKKKVANAAKSTEPIKIAIGVTDKGKLINGSFLDLINKGGSVKEDLKNYTRQAIANKSNAKQFNKGYKALIQGGKKKKGVIDKNYNQEVHDAFFGAARMQDNLMSEELGLNYAIYQGVEIKTTREFCQERLSKIFTREEISKFGTKEDKYSGYTNKGKGEFQGKSDPYDPFVDQGGYNCRHQYRWISDDLAVELAPERFQRDKNNEIQIIS